MSIVAWLVLGLAAGVVSCLLFPGRRPLGVAIALVLGAGGAVAGGLLATLFGLGTVDTLDVGGFALALVGALVLLFVHELVEDSRTART